MELNPKKHDPNKDESKKITPNSPSASSISEKPDSNIIKNRPQPKVSQDIVGNTMQQIRTYKEDVARVVQSSKISLMSAVAAEQKRKSHTIKGTVTQKHKIDFKKVGVISGSVILIVIGVVTILFFTLFYEKEEVTIEQDVPSFMFVEKQTEIDITNKRSREILQTLGNEKDNALLFLGQIAQLYVTETTKELETTVVHVISAEKFLTRIRAQVSSSFLRSLEPSFMLGIHSFDQNQPFIIFKSNSYQHSFAGLLEWERTMYQDLSLFTGRKADPALGVPIHPQTGEEIVLRENFEDKIIRNIDARALVSTAGDIELLYAFPNQQTFIITTNENTLIELITRLNSVRVF